MSWRRILLFSLLLVVALGGATWALFQHSDAATQLCRERLAALFRPQTDVAATRIEIGAGRLEFRGLAVADPTVPGRSLVQIARGHVDVRFDPFGTLIAPRHVVVEGLRIEAGPIWPTLAELLAVETGGTSGGAIDPPVVEIRSGEATLHLRAGEPPLVLEALRVTAMPLASARHLLEIEGSVTLREPAAALTLRGEVDLESGSAQFALAAGEIACTETTIAALTALAGIDRAGLDVGGEVRSLVVRCEVPPRDAIDRTPRLEAHATCAGVRVAAPDLPSIVDDAAIECWASNAEGGMLRATVRQATARGELAVTAQLAPLDGEPDVQLRATGRDVLIDDDVRAALRSFDVGADVVAALQPTAGRADVDLYLRNPHRRGGTAELELMLREVAMTYAGFGPPERRVGFPLPLVAAKGRVRLRDDVLLLEDVAAEIASQAGGGTVRLTGRIDTLQPSREDTTLDIEGEQVAFCDDLRMALATLLGDRGELYDRLAPSGRTAVRVHVRPVSELAGGFQVEVLPTGAAMLWGGFPYRLDDLRGSIVVDAARVRYELTGRHGDGGLTMRGRIPLDDQQEVAEGFEAVVDVDRLAVDEDLLRAVAPIVPRLEGPWRAAAPRGHFSGQVKVWRPRPTDELAYDVRLDLGGIDILLPQAPWRATGLEGQAVVHGVGEAARLDFDALRGRLENGATQAALLAVLGHIETGKVRGSERHDLAFVVRDLDLCDQLGRTLDELDALAYANWESLRPSGRVDLVCRHQRHQVPGENRDDRDLQVVVQLVDVRSDAAILPKPAEHMTGELHIGGGELTFRDVRAELGGALVESWDGRVRQRGPDDGRTEIAFAVRARDFPVDDGLANLFSGPLHQAVLDRQLRGRADVDGLRLVFAIPDGDDELPFSTTIQGQLGLDGVDVLVGTERNGVRVFDVHGVVDFASSTVTELGGQLVGTLRSGSLSLFSQPFEAIEAAFTADAERLQFGTLAARLHGGALAAANADAPALTYLLPGPATPDGRLVADLTFERVDVFALLSAGGWINPPYSGSASGRLTLQRLDGNDVVGAEGSGTLQIERGDLGSVPLFRAIYAQLPPGDRPRFDSLDVACRMTGEQVVFDRLEVRSNILAAKGSGRLDLDGYLDVRMQMDNLLGTSADPLVMPLIEYLAKNIVRFHLFGYLRDLQAEQRWLTEGSPGRRAALPMPPATPPVVTPPF